MKTKLTAAVTLLALVSAAPAEAQQVRIPVRKVPIIDILRALPKTTTSAVGRYLVMQWRAGAPLRASLEAGSGGATFSLFGRGVAFAAYGADPAKDVDHELAHVDEGDFSLAVPDAKATPTLTASLLACVTLAYSQGTTSSGTPAGFTLFAQVDRDVAIGYGQPLGHVIVSASPDLSHVNLVGIACRRD
jgi:hypothetical protein